MENIGSRTTLCCPTLSAVQHNCRPSSQFEGKTSQHLGKAILAFRSSSEKQTPLIPSFPCISQVLGFGGFCVFTKMSVSHSVIITSHFSSNYFYFLLSLLSGRIGCKDGVENLAKLF